MAASAAFSIPHIPVGEYLGSVYRPDVDYVDGVLEERNVGEFDHAAFQKAILLALVRQEEDLGVFAIQELRVQVSETRFRIPDICVLPSNKLPKRIVTEAPLLCIEVLSPRDTVMRMQARSSDFLRMGVPEVWIFDPESASAYVLRGASLREVREGTLHSMESGVRVDLKAIFRPAA